MKCFYPQKIKNFKLLAEEKRVHRKGYKIIVGVDEAGRGPLAGPVVAVAVWVNISKIPIQKIKTKNQVENKNDKEIERFKKLLKEIKDSKKLFPAKREKLYKLISKNSFIEWAKGIVSHTVIDKINILNATKLAMKKAIKNLNFKLKAQNPKIKNKDWKIDYLIIDGNFKIEDLKIPQKPIIKADEKIFSCICAGILAKVVRDRIMQKYHKEYPQYGFNLHKGYPTYFHFASLKKYGPCKIHRKSFYPVKCLLG